MKPMRVVIHGCGNRGAGFWMRRLARRDDVRIAGVCDLNADICAKAIAAHMPAAAADMLPRIFTDPREMYALPDLDAAFVATIHSLHHEHVRLALDAGCHVCVEKPLATSVEDSRELLELAAASGRLLQVAFNFPYSERSSGLRADIHAGRFGKVQSITALIAQPWLSMQRGTWRMDRGLSGGGMLYDTGTHLLQGVLYLHPSEPTHVYARIDQAGTAVDINGQIVVGFADGTNAAVSIVGNAPARCRINVMLDKGAIEFTSIQGHDATVTDEEGKPVELPPFDKNRRHEGNFFGAIRGEEQLRSDGRDGLRVCELLDAIFESARTGQTVALPQAVAV